MDTTGHLLTFEVAGWRTGTACEQALGSDLPNVGSCRQRTLSIAWGACPL